MNAIVPVVPAPAPHDVQDVWKMAGAIASSGLFGMKNQEQAMALMLVAQAEGMHPAAAARDYHVIQGRPALKADAMLARFMAAGGKVEWKAYSPEAVAAVFSHPQGGTVEIEWTFAQAKEIGLTSKDNWRHYPRQMLRARVISEGIRTVFPGVAVGVYTPEEVQDFDEPRGRREPPAVVETVKVIDTDPDDARPPPPEEHGLFIACKAAIDLAVDQVALNQWAKDNEASLAKIKAEEPAVYSATLAYWRTRLKALPKTAPAAEANDFGLAGDDIPDFGDSSQ